jgi:putative SOS response-associated peptidase YedK
MNLFLCPNASERLASGALVPYIISDDHRAPVEQMGIWQIAPPKPFHIPELKAAVIRRSVVVRVAGFVVIRTSPTLDLRFFFRHVSDEQLNLAGYLHGDVVQLLTCEANSLLQPLSDRMPVILTREEAATWINPLDPDVEEMMRLVRPAPIDRLSTYRIGS